MPVAAEPSAADSLVLDVPGLDGLVTALRENGYSVMGPTVQDGAILPGPIDSVADLPRGVGDEQTPARYRLTEREDDALFGYAAPATSWKPLLFPPRRLLWRGTRRPHGFDTTPPDDVPPRYALLGVRSCDLAAIAVHDRVLAQRWGQRPAADPDYAARRHDLFVVAVACGTPSQTCFCASVGTGPAPSEGFDLALTEITGEHHRFVVRVGSPAGARVLGDVPTTPASRQDLDEADDVVAQAAASMARRLSSAGLPELLDAEVEHPQWEDVAARCLACGNCTAVCPTCFCTSVQDVTDLTGDHTERWRVWDSCFSAGFSYVHGGPIRSSTKSRYRQWLSHKLGTWTAQFDTSGCVGCGRCITWCPVGIDITAEAAALQSTARTLRREDS